MDVFLDLESLALALEHYAEVYVKGWGVFGEGIVIGVLYKTSRVFSI